MIPLPILYQCALPSKLEGRRIVRKARSEAARVGVRTRRANEREARAGLAK